MYGLGWFNIMLDPVKLKRVLELIIKRVLELKIRNQKISSQFIHSRLLSSPIFRLKPRFLTRNKFVFVLGFVSACLPTAIFCCYRPLYLEFFVV